MPRFGQGPIATGRDEGLIDIPTSAMLKATVSETFATSPSVGGWNASALDEAQNGRQQADYSYSTGKVGIMPGANQAPSSPLLSKADADARIDAAGLKGLLKVPDSGMRQSAVDILIGAKTRELRNGFILDRYRGGIGGGALQFGAAFATSLVDPINIASAFVPVVGEARYAGILARSGSLASRAAVRGAVGAIEGTVGALAVEPLVYTSQRQLQADYDVYNSMLNVGFGAAFGAGLQGGLGFAGDLLARRSGMGSWAENLTSAGERELPKIQPDWIGGGGTRFIDGEDYVKGQFAIVDAGRFQAGERFDYLDVDQLGAGHSSESGAPVINPDGSPVAGSKRLGAIKRAYDEGSATDYRNSVVANADRYGFDPDAVAGMEKPVLVRVEGGREPGAWGEYSKILEDNATKNIAFHGTHVVDIDRFSLAKIGTGEGNQAYGWGLYFAQNRDVAEHYRATLGKATEITEQLRPDAIEVVKRNGYLGFDSVSEALAAVREHVDFAERWELDTAADAEILSRYRDTFGNTYKVEVPGDNRIINYDAPLRDQPEQVLLALAPYIEEAASRRKASSPHRMNSDEARASVLRDVAKQAYFDMVKSKGSPKQASEYLKSLGIPGLRFLDGKSRGQGTGDFNYVIWDEGEVNILGSNLSPNQHEASLKYGIAQAVNGEQINMLPAASLDGSRTGLEKFLEERRIAEEQASGYAKMVDARTDAQAADLERFDPAQADKAEQEVADLERQLRDSLKATGADEADIEGLMAEISDLSSDLKAEESGLRGISMCLMRSV